jgi:predicted Zn-dependent protease
VLPPPVPDSPRAARPAQAPLAAEIEREERVIARAEPIEDDPSLTEYLERLAGRLARVGPGEAGTRTVRVTVVRRATLNAFVMPDGHLYLHTGLLARLDNEAQLAMIMSREIALARLTTRGPSRWPRAAPSRHASRVFSRAALPLAFVAAVRGYGSDLEREADAEGLRLMIGAGYDPREAPSAFARLADAAAAPGAHATFYLGDRATLEERLASTRELVAAREGGVAPARLTRDTEEFALRLRVVVRENAAADARAGRFGLASEELDRVLALTPLDPVAHLYRGDLYRLESQRPARQEDADALLHRAREEYAQAARLDPLDPTPFRQLGLLEYQRGRNVEAVEAFRRYLAIRPDAPDAARIRAYVVDLERR